MNEGKKQEKNIIWTNLSFSGYVKANVCNWQGGALPNNVNITKSGKAFNSKLITVAGI